MTSPTLMTKVSRFLLVPILSLGMMTACSDLQSSTEQPSATAATIPAEWPEVVPLFEDGALFAGYVADGGSVVASWEVPGTPDSEVAGVYERQLRKAGFHRTEWFSNLAESGYVYAGHGLKVSVGTLESEGTTSLDVSVTCTSGCEDWPQTGG